MGVKSLAQERNTMSQARARTRTAHSGVEHTNHEATVPSTVSKKNLLYCMSNSVIELALDSTICLML